jgi:hypothetical protein
MIMDDEIKRVVKRLNSIKLSSGLGALILEVRNQEAVAEAADLIKRLAAERDAKDETIRFIERWVNHHAQKPNITPREVLSMIQHYPPIKEITESYVDGKVPDTPDPWQRTEAAKAEAMMWHGKLVEAEAEVARLREQLARCGGENCMGYREDGVARWVREERLLAANREVAKLREALREAREYVESEYNERLRMYDGYPNLAYKYEAEKDFLARIDVLLGATDA